MGLEAKIWASSLGFGLQDWDLGLEAGTYASRLGFGPRDQAFGLETNLSLKVKIWVRKEWRWRKFPMCESVGHPFGTTAQKGRFGI